MNRDAYAEAEKRIIETSSRFSLLSITVACCPSPSFASKGEWANSLLTPELSVNSQMKKSMLVVLHCQEQVLLKMLRSPKPNLLLI